MKKVVIIGSGFAGLSAASFMAKAGWDVTVVEKNSIPGGRARQLQEKGFVFDMGPSWYWMPEVFERFFNSFGKKVADYYQLQRLDPSYRIYWKNDKMDVPAEYKLLKELFESIEPGSSAMLDKVMKEAAYKYEVGINKLVHKPGQSIAEFLDWDLIKGVFKLDVFNSIKRHFARHFKDPRIKQLLEFPVLFLGALPQDTPALYSLMNYADIKLGTWYPKGGMYKIVEGMYSVAKELGVKFIFDCNVKEIKVENGLASKVLAQLFSETEISFDADVVIGAADYNFIETKLLQKKYRTYTDKYWDTRVMAPSCLLYYVGLNKKLTDVLHHTLFFDVSFDVHGNEIYKNPQWPSNPLFYVCAASVTDETVAPDNCENLFFLIPVATGLQGDTEILRNEYFEKIVKRFEERIGQNITDAIIYKRSYSVSNFIEDYNSFKGNAYGLANTLLQTAILKPACRSKKVANLFYTGQLTVPGPGVPPSLISGEVVAKQVIKNFS
ncbi:phytoene desaturase [Ferruginibacter lapsinanis]|uniref:phytoene desaturase family protein n=1 Tax=Ferruginibacter lapsinanis TaxID=563172 RepID=UPI001E592B18|nr:phytoene desaturase family protein [Ferruginibacter lapsinanis]UEG50545.1 phytoene desaturase [Ferruginibacter lapsinanis]